MGEIALPGTSMEVENGPLEDNFLLVNNWFSTSMLVPRRVSLCLSCDKFKKC